jgi:hypothetical protein
MKRHSRTPAFDTLECLAPLSAVNPAVGLVAHVMQRQQRPPAFVRAVVQAARRMGGTHITVTPTIAVPGSFTDYQITFQARGRTFTTVITIPVPQHPGPTPG